MAPKQILVADNDSSALESVRFLLKAAGYNVYLADSAAACDELLSQQIIHAAIIDLRLTDNQHMEDVSGFDVARALPDHIPFIIYTAYQNITNLREALSDVGAKDMVNKSAVDASQQLLVAVQKLFAEHVPLNFDLEISGSITPAAISASIKLPDSSLIDASSEDISQILRRLFRYAEAVTLEPLFSEESRWFERKSRSVLLCVRPQYADGGMGAPMVVKFGASTHIHHEEENYGQLIRFIGGTRLTVLEEAAHSREMGALCYRLFGPAEPQSVNHFGDLFADPAIQLDEIGDLVRHFFDETFSGIYFQAKPQTIDLFAHYGMLLELDVVEMSTIVADFFRDSDQADPSIVDQTVSWPQLGQVLPDPMLWVAPDSRWRNMPIQTKECLCHGDMHSRNLLVDSVPSLWLIDFERVATCHWLRDYIELETDVKFQLGAQMTLADFLAMEEDLVNSPFGGLDQPCVETDNPTAKDAHRFIALLRHDAQARFALAESPIDYYAALLISALNVMQLRSTSSTVMEQAFLSASLLCAKIKGALAD